MAHICADPTKALIIHLLRRPLETRIKMYERNTQNAGHYNYCQTVSQGALYILVDSLFCMHFVGFVLGEYKYTITKH